MNLDIPAPSPENPQRAPVVPGGEAPDLAAEGPPLISEVAPEPLVPETERGAWRASLRRSLVGGWKLLVGVWFCQSLLGSVLIVGWTYRLMRGAALKSWVKHVMPNPNRTTRAASAPEPKEPLEHRPWPNWLLQQRSGSSARPPAESGDARAGSPWFKALFHSLWLNLKMGVQGILNTWVLTLPGCALWLFAWYDGWNNSFNKGYEQAPIGPTTGVIGILLFVAAMLYVPMAQARQAVTGDWRAFYQFGLVWRLIRRRWSACVLLAALYALLSVPIMILKSAPMFFPQIHPAIGDFTPQQTLHLLHRYFFWAGFVVFPSYVLVRVFAARIYAASLLAGLRQGEIAPASLGAWERQELRRLDLIQVHPPRARHVLIRIATTTSGWAWRATAIVASTFLWFLFAAQVFASEFFMAHPVLGWLNQPLVQLPWFHYVPIPLKNPAPEIFLTLLALSLILAGRRLTIALGTGRRPIEPS